MSYRIRFTKLAQKDIKKLSPKLKAKLQDILRNRLAVNPFSGKVLIGDLEGYYSVRLSYKDRIVYSIHEAELVVVVVRAKTHYGE
ncbi:MAG: type II toxin-antitoxin system mRNA interferase toxin, RelE/StbE family [Proteobacteria bacterium]|nr:type II toxin-antitoxin system mRNA interferase toxin, RelE/StbE family [Pseudomonadota bacterium]MBT5794109.1 type II toxin-antitoxin system mRNA interferase toxin, RelE/StbE family [Deltaproteobacteria bacterium]